MPFTKQEKDHILKIISDQKLPVRHHQGWKNFTENLHDDDALVLNFSDEKSLSIILAEIYKLNAIKAPTQRTLSRGAAGGRVDEKNKLIENSESFSLAPGVTSNDSPTNIILCLSDGEFLEVKKVDDRLHIKAGVQVGEADEQGTNKLGRVLPTNSLIKYVTEIGLLNNGGHDAGTIKLSTNENNNDPNQPAKYAGQPSVAGLATAFRICLANGKIVRIRHPERNLRVTNEDIEISKEDFEAIAGANLGLFGMILEAEIDTIPVQKVKRVSKAISLAELIERPTLFLDKPYVHTGYTPTFQKDELTNKELKNVIVYTWEPVDLNTPDSNFHPELNDTIQKFEIEMEKDFHIAEILAKFPSLVPYYNRYFVAEISIIHAESEVTGNWNEGKHYQTRFPKGINDLSCQLATKQDCLKIALIYKILALKLQEAAEKGEYPVNYSGYGRLFGGTNGGLSPSQHEEGELVFALDIISQTPELKGYQEFIEAFLKEALGPEIKAKLHWGKQIPKPKTSPSTDPNDLNNDVKSGIDYAKMYGKDFDQFIKTLKWWHEVNKLDFERNMFLTKHFCDILQMPELAPVPQPKNHDHKILSNAPSVVQFKPAPAPVKDDAHVKQYAESFLKHLAGEKSDAAIALHNELSNVLGYNRYRCSVM